MDNYYNLFIQFVNTFKAQGFKDIPGDHPLLTVVEEKLKATKQCFHINNLVQMRIVYCTPTCTDFFGIPREEIDPELYYERTHPSDKSLHASARSRLMRAAHEIYLEKAGKWFLSGTLQTRNVAGEYVDLLYQIALSYSDDPHPAVYGIQVNTNVSEMMKEIRGVHYYTGEDESVFRPPDEALLRLGPGFSEREFEILQCIAQGLDSEEIAQKLFLSVHTINTHRRNILEKSGSRSTHELVIKMQGSGLI